MTPPSLPFLPESAMHFLTNLTSSSLRIIIIIIASDISVTKDTEGAGGKAPRRGEVYKKL